MRLRGRAETFFTQDLVFFAARWCHVKSLLPVSHDKIDHLLLVLCIQKTSLQLLKLCTFIFFVCFFQN